MSGDWIKMRGNLWDDPRVSALVDATDSSEAAIVGALYWLWATADQHTEDGVKDGGAIATKFMEEMDWDSLPLALQWERAEPVIRALAIIQQTSKARAA